MTCGECRFYREEESNSHGICVRFPPQACPPGFKQGLQGDALVKFNRPACGEFKITQPGP